MPNSNDISFEEAFNLAAQEYDESGNTTAVGNSNTGMMVEDPSVIKATHSTEPSAEDENNTEPGANVDDQSGTDSEDTSTESDSGTVNYEDLLEQARKESDAQIRLLNSRLQSLSAQYQELKSQTKQQQAAPAHDAKDATDEPDLPDSFKELMEEFPDFAKPMQEYVERQVQKALKSVTSAVEERVRPIETHIDTTETNSHLNAIRSAHPDFDEIVGGFDLLQWIESLPPVARTGAVYVAERGSTDQVIALLNDYKAARNLSTKNVNTAPSKSSPAKASTQTKAAASEEDAIVKKVLAALSVPSKKGAPQDVKSNEIPDDFAAAFDAYAKEYEARTRDSIL